MFSSEIFRCEVWIKRNNVSEECTESIFVEEGERNILESEMIPKILLTECLAMCRQALKALRES